MDEGLQKNGFLSLSFDDKMAASTNTFRYRTVYDKHAEPGDVLLMGFRSIMRTRW